MKDWENDYAASLIYQDLADCSLWICPVAAELEETKTVKKVAKLEDENLANVNVLKKVSVLLFLFITLVTTV